MRTWATAIAWWQGDECCYWGHNAAIRIAAFRAHARLPTLPGGRHILSHDQVEAAMLAGAGWGVRLIPDEDGSAEVNPPAFPEFVRREMRWLAGNLEYRHLLAMPGLRAMGRWQLVQAILLFGCSPFYVLAVGGLAWVAASGQAVDRGWAAAASIGWVAAIYSPKLLGYAEVLLSARTAAARGSRRARRSSSCSRWRSIRSPWSIRRRPWSGCWRGALRPGRRRTGRTGVCRGPRRSGCSGCKRRWGWQRSGRSPPPGRGV
jgi:membrane glycosyltransferase